MSDTNFTNLGYVAETVFGTTPSSALQLLRRTGGNLTPKRGTKTSEEIRSDLRAGKPVRVSQHAEGSVNVEWSYTTLDDMLAGLLMEDWASDVLVDGTTKKSFTFEDQFVDPEISPSQYMIYKGCRIGSISLSLALESIVTGSLGIMGTVPSIAQASAGTGNTAATTTGVFNTVDMIETLEQGASGSTPAAINRLVGLDLNIDRALRMKNELGALNAFGIGTGRLRVTGTVKEYFESDRLMDEWFSFNDRQIVFELQDEAGNNLRAEIPKYKMVGDPSIEISGPDGDVFCSYSIEAYANIGDAALIRFTRTAA